MKRVLNRNLGWLLLGSTLLALGNGRFLLPAAAWFALIFLVRYIRGAPGKKGVLIAVIAHTLAFWMAWRGAVPLPVPFQVAVITALSGIFFVPLLIDRALSPRVSGFAQTLVLPLTWVSVEYLNAHVNPYGSWVSVAYTQWSAPAFMQSAALFGLWGLAALIPWSAAVVNWIWEGERKLTRARVGLPAVLAVAALTFVYGSSRLRTSANALTAHIAGVSISREMHEQTVDRMWSDDPEAYREASLEQFQYFMAESGAAVAAGAELVFWAEAAVGVAAQDEADFVQAASDFAGEAGIYFVPAFWVVTQSFPQVPAENKLLWIDPSGRVMTEYHKSIPVPGEPIVPGDGSVPIFDTPFGRIAAVICFDMDFPHFIRSATRSGVDIMLAPSADWSEIDPIHTRMASVRGIENGFTVVRSVFQGRSSVTDAYGRVLVEHDYFTTSDHTIHGRRADRRDEYALRPGRGRPRLDLDDRASRSVRPIRQG